jgi:hypothetical protein
VALAVTLHTTAGRQQTRTIGVSQSGLSLLLDPAPAVGSVHALQILLPDGSILIARGTCRSHRPQHIVGFSLEFEGDDRSHWERFVEEEETSGSMWRMIGRIAAAPDDAFAARGVVETHAAASLRFHTVGENGLAYRLAFHKHPSDPPEESDLCIAVPGFREPARRLVRRVLRDDLTLRFDGLDGSGEVITTRVVELVRGGYAWVSQDSAGGVAFIALAGGELLLVEKDGATVFPHLSDGELEQVACDTFRHDLSRPLFANKPKKAPRPVELPPLPPPGTAAAAAVASPPAPAPARAASASAAPAMPAAPVPSTPPTRRFTEGYDAVRFAQAAADDVQVRRYGERDIYFHPSVWAKVRVEDGSEFMGPTMQDAGRVCVLGLVGPGAPRVVRLHDASVVALLKRRG